MARTDINTKGTYIMVRKIMNKGVITNYIIMDKMGNRVVVDRDKFYGMAGEGGIINVKRGGEVLIGCGVKLSQIRETDTYTGRDGDGLGEADVYNRIMELLSVKKYRVVGRIIKGNACVGYTVIDNEGTKRNIDKKQMIELVQKNMVQDVSYQNYNGRVIIKGNKGFNINTLPVSVDISNKENKAKYKVSGSIVKNGRKIGYVLTDLISNETKNISIVNAVEAVKRKVIAGVELKSNGEYDIIGAGVDKVAIVE